MSDVKKEDGGLGYVLHSRDQRGSSVMFLALFLSTSPGSMQEGWGGEPGKSKADALSTIINGGGCFRMLVFEGLREESEGVRDYYDVGVIGYGAAVGPAFSGPLAGKELVPIGEIANQPARVEERTKKSR